MHFLPTMFLFCEKCGRKGSLEEASYTGKRLRLRCPYCSNEFLYVLPRNGDRPIEPEAVVREQQAAAVSDETEAAVFEAKRIARLIITEIKLYNQEKIERAESQKEVLELLKNDLRRGKEHYDSRIASRLPLNPDYFMDSVREILLAGKD
jgi:DNA-directed RNA polymerase subunit RPC12/RpoP